MPKKPREPKPKFLPRTIGPLHSPVEDPGLYLFLAQDGSLMARVPARGRFTASTFKVPQGQPGLDVLYRVLQARAERPREGGVGTEASPNVSMVEEWLRAHGGPTKPKQRERKGELTLEDLGLSGDAMVEAMTILGQIEAEPKA